MDNGKAAYAAAETLWQSTQTAAQTIRSKYSEFVRDERLKRQEADLAALKAQTLNTLNAQAAGVSRAITGLESKVRAIRYPDTTAKSVETETARQFRMGLLNDTLELAALLPMFDEAVAGLLLARGQVDVLSTYVDLMETGAYGDVDEPLKASQLKAIKRIAEGVPGLAQALQELRDWQRAAGKVEQVRQLTEQGLFNVQTVQEFDSYSRAMEAGLDVSRGLRPLTVTRP